MAPASPPPRIPPRRAVPGPSARSPGPSARPPADPALPALRSARTR